MKHRAWQAGLMMAVAATAGTACRSAGTVPSPQVIQPGAPGQPSRLAGAGTSSPVRYMDADVRFMQGMIGHHAQALEMTALLPSRTASEPMKLLARRIEISQADEIKMMQAWLRERGLPVPDPHAHHAPGARLMPGMLTPDEMTRLAQATGPVFDRLFLELMIRHHEGALVMVKELFSTAGAGQDSDIFAFASDVEADQSMEIERMRRMRGSDLDLWKTPRSRL